MSNPFKSRVSRLLVAAAMFLVAVLYSPPTIPSISADRPEPPTPAEIEALATLSEWVLGGSSSPMFEGFKDRSLDENLEAAPIGFELFRRYHGAEAQNEMIRRLPYSELIRSAAARYDLDPLLLASMIEAESGFDPNALSVVGAIGLMQVIPSTAELYSDGDPFDPAVNVDVGARYLRSLLRQFDGDTALALAAYNAGPGNVIRHEGVPPFRETRRYVERVMARYIDYHQRIWEDSTDRSWFLR